MDDIWVELTKLKDMVAVCKSGSEEELSKIVVQEDWYLEQSMTNQSS